MDHAKESLVEAIKLEPNDKKMREDYKNLVQVKTEKENMWTGKMKGFYHNKKLAVIEAEDTEASILREKIKRQTFGDLK